MDTTTLVEPDFAGAMEAYYQFFAAVPTGLRLVMHTLKNLDVAQTYYPASPYEAAQVICRPGRAPVHLELNLAPPDAPEIKTVGGLPAALPWGFGFEIRPRYSSTPPSLLQAAASWVNDAAEFDLMNLWTPVFTFKQSTHEGGLYVGALVPDVAQLSPEAAATARHRIRRIIHELFTSSNVTSGNLKDEVLVVPTISIPAPNAPEGYVPKPKEAHNAA